MNFERNFIPPGNTFKPVERPRYPNIPTILGNQGIIITNTNIQTQLQIGAQTARTLQAEEQAKY